jgi:hypothetical protein
MHYRDIRESIRDGDLVLVRGRSWQSWFIRQWTQSRFSHCGIAVWVSIGGVGRLCLLEAVQDHGVRMLPLSQLLDRDGEFDWFELQSAFRGVNRRGIVGFATEQWGKRYASAWQFVRSFSCGIRRVADWMGFEVDTDPHRLFCSEFVVGALGAGGFHPSRDVEPAEMSPGDVAELGCFLRKGRVTR